MTTNGSIFTILLTFLSVTLSYLLATRALGLLSLTSSFLTTQYCISVTCLLSSHSRLRQTNTHVFFLFRKSSGDIIEIDLSYTDAECGTVQQELVRQSLAEYFIRTYNPKKLRRLKTSLSVLIIDCGRTSAVARQDLV